MERKVPIGNVIKEFNIGNTRIKICDDACKDKTPENIDIILKRIASIGWEIVNAERARNKDM